MFRLISLFILLHLITGLCFTNLLAQNACTTLGQTPQSAFPVCGTDTFRQTLIPLCGKDTIVVPTCPASFLLDGFTINNLYTDKNPYWYKFTCFKGGTLGFTITPDSSEQDFDWQLFDVTGHDTTLNDLYKDSSMFVSCNWSGGFGITGAKDTGTSLCNCGGNPFIPPVPTISAMPTLIEKHNYMLLVSHFSDSSSGYRLAFFGGTASITDTTPPKMRSAKAPCDGTNIFIKLNKRMKCGSIALDGTDFSINTATSKIISASGVKCDGSFDTDSVLLVLNNPIPPGKYKIYIQKGSDGSTILDNCGNGIPDGDSLPVTIYPQFPTPMDTFSIAQCKPTQMVVTFSKNIQCSSIASDGSDFIIKGNHPIVVDSAYGNCDENGLTNTITVRFKKPVTLGGLDTIVLQKGSDSNTLINECGKESVVGSYLPFVTYDTVSTAFTKKIVNKCNLDSITFSSDSSNNKNSWLWQFSDGTTASGCNISKSFYIPVVNNTITLKTTNGGCTDSSFQVLNLGYDSLKMDTLSIAKCLPTQLIVTFNKPVQCNSISPDGSNFTIGGNQPVAIDTAINNCNATTGLTKTVTLKFHNPIKLQGNDTLYVRKSKGGKALLDSCGVEIIAGSALSFATYDTVSATFTKLVDYSCANVNITCTNVKNNHKNTWQWHFSDGDVESGFTFTRTIPLASLKDTITLNVSNGACTDSSFQVVNLFADTLHMDTLSIARCKPSQLVLTFNKNIQCSFIASDGSDFFIKGNHPVLVDSAYGSCDKNGLTKTVTVRFKSPITLEGADTIVLQKNSIGNTITSECGQEIVLGSYLPFVTYDTVSAAFSQKITYNCNLANLTFTNDSTNHKNSWLWKFSDGTTSSGFNTQKTFQLPTKSETINLQTSNGFCADTTFQILNLKYDSLRIDSISLEKCLPKQLIVFFNQPIKCNTIAADGSNFSIGGNHPANIVSATSTCNATTGLTKSITLQFLKPISLQGIDTLYLKKSKVDSSLLDSCDIENITGSALSFATYDTVSAAFNKQVDYSCASVNITCTNDKNNQKNTWQWHFSDGDVESGFTFTRTIPLASLKDTITLNVSNGACTDSSFQVVNLFADTLHMDTLSIARCKPSQLVLTFNKNIQCSFIASDGSDFFIKGNHPVLVDSAYGSCDKNGLTKTVTVRFKSPITLEGADTIVLQKNSIGNTITSECGQEIVLGSYLPFVTYDTVSAAFSQKITYNCNLANLTFTNDSTNHKNSWLWKFSDGTTALGFNTTKTFNLPVVNKTITLKPSNGVCADSSFQVLNLLYDSLKMDTLSIAKCLPTQLIVTFNKPVQCNSIAADGSNFSIGGNHPVNILSALSNCNPTTGLTKSITLKFNKPINLQGIDTLYLKKSNSGKPLLDSCGIESIASNSLTFATHDTVSAAFVNVIDYRCSYTNISCTNDKNNQKNSWQWRFSDGDVESGFSFTRTVSLIPLNDTISLRVSNGACTDSSFQVMNLYTDSLYMDTFSVVQCAPKQVVISFKSYVQCNSIAADGSNFIINGTYPILIDSAFGDCKNSSNLSRTVTVRFKNPVAHQGTFTISMKKAGNGSYLLDECGKKSSTSNKLSFHTYDSVSAAFTPQVKLECTIATITMSNPANNHKNSFLWQFSDGAIYKVDSFSRTIPITDINDTIRLKVSNGYCVDSTFRVLKLLAGTLQAAFTIPEFYCPNEELIVQNQSTGTINNYLWEYSDGVTSNLPAPPNRTFPPISNEEKDYTLKLTIGNLNNCIDSSMHTIRVMQSCFIGVPSVFTPDSREGHRKLYPEGIFKAIDFTFVVYNRFGQLVFTSHNFNDKWDGTTNGNPQPSGTYVWMLTYRETLNSPSVFKNGTTVLLR